MSTAVSTDSWTEEVLKAEKPVLVDFWAEWCGPCLVIAPVLDEIAADLGEKAKIVKLNVDENPGIARQFNVLSIPTLMLFKDGEPVDSMIGAQPKANITSMINKAL